jgi:hypothetical protein
VLTQRDLPLWDSASIERLARRRAVHTHVHRHCWRLISVQGTATLASSPTARLALMPTATSVGQAQVGRRPPSRQPSPGQCWTLPPSAHPCEDASKRNMWRPGQEGQERHES